MTDQEKRMLEMAVLLFDVRRLPEGQLPAGWIARHDALLAPQPDPDAGTKELQEIYNVAWVVTDPLAGWRAIAAWADKRVGRAKRDILTEAIERLGNDVAGASVLATMLRELEDGE